MKTPKEPTFTDIVVWGVAAVVLIGIILVCANGGHPSGG